MSYQRYTAQECTLALEAYIRIRDSDGSFAVSNPVLVDLKSYLNSVGISSRSISSLTMLMSNYRYQDVGIGCANISSTALEVWKKYLDMNEENIDKNRLRVDCNTIRASLSNSLP